MEADQDHPYRRLKIPPHASFELKPSPGKGWGAFATRPLKRGDLILAEQPLFYLPSYAASVDSLNEAVRKLSEEDEQQVLCLIGDILGDVRGPEFMLKQFYAHNLFGFRANGVTMWAFHILRGRFNHSCLPNAHLPSGLPPHRGGCWLFARQDIAEGEEITFCYDAGMYVMTVTERRVLMRNFICQCVACNVGTAFQSASDMRQRLVRGLFYLCKGRDGHLG